jgi:predicted dehydrogenase
MQTLGVGLVGLHHLHTLDYIPHFEAIPQTEVRAIAEPDDVYRNRACAQTGLDGHADYVELLDRDDIHLVAIFLPHNECPEAVEKAAALGKHVIVEKPMASTSAGIRRMIDAARKGKVALTPPYCWRAHPASRQIKQLVDAGALGRIVALEGRCAAGSPSRYLTDNLSPWLVEKEAAGGGPMHNLGVHWIDLFRWFLEDEAQTVTGMVSHTQHSLDVEDNSFAIMRFRGGATATLDISYSVPKAYPAGRDLFLSVRGTLGTISWSPAWGGSDDEVFLVSDHVDYEDGPVNTLQIGSRAVTGYGGISGFAYLRETIDAITEGREPAITGSDGLRAIEVVEAIYQSADTGRAVDVAYQDPS